MWLSIGLKVLGSRYVDSAALNTAFKLVVLKGKEQCGVVLKAKLYNYGFQQVRRISHLFAQLPCLPTSDCHGDSDTKMNGTHCVRGV